MSSATVRPRIVVSDTAPLTVRGLDFKPRQRVTVVAETPARHVRAVTTTVRGTFVVRFLTLKLSTCSAYFVRATAARGVTVTVVRKLVPSCPPPPQPVDG